MAGLGITAVVQSVVDALTAAGLNASADPAGLNLPGVWVGVESISPELLSGDGTVTLRLNACVPNTVYLDALTMLDELLADVLDVVDSEGDITPITVALPDGQAVPSYQLNVLRPYERN